MEKRPGRRLLDKSIVVVMIPDELRLEMDLTDVGPLNVVYEDDHVLIVDKPAGLVVHPSGRHLTDTLIQRMHKHFRSKDAERDVPVKLCHRLDRETSGLMILARTPEAMEGLQAAFRARQVRKQYLALVHGRLAEEHQILRWGLDAMEKHRDRQQALPSGKGKNAETMVEQLEQLGPCSLVLCRPRTGRRHQIRVHLHAAGAPIVGDKIYGAKSAPRLPEGAPPLRAHALHACGLEFAHPIHGGVVSFESPPREELEELVAWLRTNC